MGFRLRLLLLCSACWLVTQAAWAQRVLVLQPSPKDATLYEAFGRLRGELDLHGFEVVVLESDDQPVDADALELEAQRLGAFAAVALQRKGNGTTADVCIVDRVTGKTTTRKLTIETSRDGPTLLAIRAVDLLRSSLLELPSGERPPKDVLGVAPEPAALEVTSFAHDAPPFQVRMGGLGLLSPQLGASFGVTLGLRYRPSPRLRIGFELGGPLFGGEFHAPDGSAHVRQEFALVQATWNLSSATSGRRWEWGPVLGLGVSHLQATGDVTPPLLAQTDDSWSLALRGGAGIEYFFNDTVSLGVELAALGLIPQPVVAVSDERSAPLAIQAVASLSLGVSF